jgi:hypothetical protein
MIFERSNAAPHSVQQTLGVAAVWELKGNTTYGAAQAHWTLCLDSNSVISKSCFYAVYFMLHCFEEFVKFSCLPV